MVLLYSIAGIRLVSNFETLISLDASVASWVGSLFDGSAAKLDFRHAKLKRLIYLVARRQHVHVERTVMHVVL